VIARWSEAGIIPPLLIATPDVGPWSFYLDDPARGMGWESFVCERFVPHVRSSFDVTVERAALVGISMGGYGALKVALAGSREFAAVAAISPMLEPAEEACEVGPRNRYHYPPEVPQALLGPERDAALYRRDHPAQRARANLETLRSHALAISLDSAGSDVLNAHDGAEYLQTLWLSGLAMLM
jgi:S-formylglutathione hydrolase FrmB